jgi:cyclophilin family peptidyl-prolyl cis-trans isomerase
VNSRPRSGQPPLRPFRLATVRLRIPATPHWLIGIAVGMAGLIPDVAAAQSTRSTAVTERAVLEAEHTRAEDVSVLLAALKSSEPRLQRIAVRALGRLERSTPEIRTATEAMLRASDPLVRAEAVNALGQMNAPYAFSDLLRSESDASVRGVIYETIGRVRPTPGDAESVLVRGLADIELPVRAGAARGLESLMRRTARSQPPSQAALTALRKAALDPWTTGRAEELHTNALLAMAAAGDRDSATVESALRDASVQVRRVAVQLARRWVDDTSYVVRLQALRYAGTCERFIAATNDANEHVVLAAIDTLGMRRCDNAVLTRLADNGRTWRMKAHAMVSLARVAPDLARPRMPTLSASPVWQARTYAATAARALGDMTTLNRLARDAEPNVAIAAMSTNDDALRALRTTNHAALVMAAVDQLAGDPVRNAPLPAPALSAMLDALDRLTRRRVVTVRDPRVKLLNAIAMGADTARVLALVTPLISDRDPAVASAAAEVATKFSGAKVLPVTTRYQPPPASLPSEAYLRALLGATAELTIRGLGRIQMSLFSESATVAVATFAALADSGKFNGLTFHRIVPNFVVQGASPGANEYDALTSWFMRDELGLTRNSRGTFGISTRGRDTGDGQIYINLIDNFRLDHDYTVFARTMSGLDVIDRIQEGDVIESVRIIRPTRNR